MTYIEKHLMPGEEIAYQTRPHPIYLFVGKRFWAWVLTVFLFAVGGWPLSVLLLLGIFLPYLMSEYAITNRRLIMKGGVVARKMAEIRIDKIESLQVEEGIIGRLLGYGNLHVIGSGGSEANAIAVLRPWKIRDAYMNGFNGNF